jgi:hypothetical protein
MTCANIVNIQARNGKVTIAGGAAKRIALERRTIARIIENRPKTVALARTTPVQAIDRPTVVHAGTPGLQGPPGTGAGGGIPPIAFAYGDAPGTVWTAPVAGRVVLARVTIDPAFDGAGAEVLVGTAGTPGLLVDATRVAPSMVGDYELTPDVDLLAGTAVRITINPGSGASQGAGVLFLDFVPTT